MCVQLRVRLTMANRSSELRNRHAAKAGSRSMPLLLRRVQAVIEQINRSHFLVRAECNHAEAAGPYDSDSPVHAGTLSIRQAGQLFLHLFLPLLILHSLAFLRFGVGVKTSYRCAPDPYLDSLYP